MIAVEYNISKPALVEARIELFLAGEFSTHHASSISSVILG